MSNCTYLIQPIELTDWTNDESLGLQCIKHGNTTPKWRTVSTLLNADYIGYGTLTALAGAENDDKWVKVFTDQWINAGVKFATSCLKKATLRFYLPEITQVDTQDGTPFGGVRFEFELYINQVAITPSNGYLLGGPFGGIDDPDTYIVYPLDISTPAQTVDYVVDLEALGIACSPRGNTWQIRFNYYVGSTTSVTGVEGNMTLEIVDVTF
jgi:hypothetical protein